MIGVIFFGLLANHATPVARDYSPGLQRALVAQHVPPPVAARIVQQFQQCFHDRSSEKDPSVVPPSCQFPKSSNPAVSQILSKTATEARKQNFSDSFDWSLLFNIGLWSATFFLLFALPYRPRAHGEAPPGGQWGALQLIVEGRTDQEIADQLFLSVKTVQTHRAHFLRKLGAHDRADLVKHAISVGMIPPETLEPQPS